MRLDHADVVQGKDVGMGERSDRPRFLLETAQSLGIGREFRRQHLDRDVAIQPCVARPVHVAHPARADRRDDLVRAETGTGC